MAAFSKTTLLRMEADIGEWAGSSAWRARNSRLKHVLVAVKEAEAYCLIELLSHSIDFNVYLGYCLWRKLIVYLNKGTSYSTDSHHPWRVSAAMAWYSPVLDHRAQLLLQHKGILGSLKTLQLPAPKLEDNFLKVLLMQDQRDAFTQFYYEMSNPGFVALYGTNYRKGGTGNTPGIVPLLMEAMQGVIVGLCSLNMVEHIISTMIGGIARLEHLSEKRDTLPLHFAVTRDCRSLMELFAKLGADFNVANSSNGWTVLHHVASSKHRSEQVKLELVQFLISHGAKVDVLTRAGETAALFERRNGNYAGVLRLLEPENQE